MPVCGEMNLTSGPTASSARGVALAAPGPTASSARGVALAAPDGLHLLEADIAYH